MSRLVRAALAATLVSLAFGFVAGSSALAGSRGVCNTAYDPAINAADFTNARGRPNPINNPYFPLRPGTTYVYDGEKDGAPQHDNFAVTNGTKTIIGVTTVVVRDTVNVGGFLAEDTLDWFAQDDAGNVWYFGEDTKEYDEAGNVISTEGSWEAGVNGAKPGIVMEAQPENNDTYRQEFASGVAEDMARVLHLGLKVTVPYGSFNHCIETEEFTPLEPGVREVKFYCPGIGFVKGRDVQGGTAHLALTLVSR